MPVITVEMWKGRTNEQKKDVIKGITEVFEKMGVPKEHTTIIIHDVPKENWGTRGVQAANIVVKK